MKIRFVGYTMIISFFFLVIISVILGIGGLLGTPVKHPSGAFFIAAIFGFLTFITATRYERKYRTCPNCDKEMLVKTDWLCPFCDNTQGEDKLVAHSCNNCGRKLKEIYCEHCNERLALERWL